MIQTDFQSVLQPALALVYNAWIYENEEINGLTDLLAEKFNEISTMKAKGERKFKAYLKDAKSKNEFALSASSPNALSVATTLATS